MKKNHLKWAFLFTCFIAPCYAQSKALTDYISQFNSQVTRSEPLSFTGAYESGKPMTREISLYYSWQQPMKKDLARQKFVEFTNQFLEGLNHNMLLKSQLEPFPFSAKGLDVVIFFRNDEGKYAKPPNIGQISLKSGEISYYEYVKGEFKLIDKESFFEAKQKIFK